jgi:hypothetical protein
MSRFLHSIIATAQNPSASVHPVVPSLFSSSAHHESPADMQDAPSATLLGRETVAPTAPRSARRDAAPFGTAFDIETARNATDTQNRRTGKPLTQPIAPLSDAPEVSRDRARNFASAPRPFERAPSAGTWNSPSEPAFRAPFGNDSAPMAEAARNPDGRYSPEAPNAPPHGSNPPALEPLVSPAMTQVRRAGEDHASRDLAPRPRSPAREPEEIQIHIGRIEVTAARPAPARSAPVAARKSPSLDEYLKRRPGRTR